MAELLFVYNADAGLANALLDSLHKTFSPATYSCSLCAVTYGTTRMRPEWRAFLQSLPVQTSFLHRDELARAYPALASEPLPAVFYRLSPEQPWQVLLSAAELKPLELPALMTTVKQRLSDIAKA